MRLSALRTSSLLGVLAGLELGDVVVGLDLVLGDLVLDAGVQLLAGPRRAAHRVQDADRPLPVVLLEKFGLEREISI